MGVLKGTEILQVVDTVAREKNITREEVIEAMEMAMQKLGKANYGLEYDIRAKIDPVSGEVALSRHREVVEEVDPEISLTQITLEEAKEIDPELEIGSDVVDELPPIEFGRVAAQTAKQVIFQRVREAERLSQFNEYKDRVGELISGVVKRSDYNEVVVDLGRTEGVIRRDQQIPREVFRVGERVRAYLADVRSEVRGPQIFLSRTHPQFLVKLFTQEVPEIYDGVINLVSAARDPGSRAKISVTTNDASIDPVGACVGVRGSRVQAVVSELQGERVDIVPWSSEPATYVVNALAPAEISKVVLDEDSKRVEVVVPEEQLSLAIGRRGQNVRLAALLTGWDIDLATEEQEAERRAEEFKIKSQRFIEALDVDDVIAHLLVAEGFSTVEEITETPIEELATIEGFDESVAGELQERAMESLKELAEVLTKKCEELEVDASLIEMEGLSLRQVVLLAENDIKTSDDFADLASDEVLEYLGAEAMNRKEAEELIMKARAHWFAEEEAAKSAVVSPEAEAEAEAEAAAEAEAEAEAEEPVAEGESPEVEEPAAEAGSEEEASEAETPAS